jgi:hypothetical protein
MIISCAAGLASCSRSESFAVNKTASSNTGASTVVASKTTKSNQVAMKMSKKCEPTNLHQSICMVELILADISRNYGWVGGGGVSDIKLLSSTTYQITLPQEERDDIYTYEFEVKKDGTVSMIGKTESAKSY